MSEPFLAEIAMFAGNFNPSGWAFCDGQLLPIAQNTALFSLIGTTYGGDGRTTTGLPNLKGRLPMHPGRGPGLTARSLGQRSGTETVTLSTTQMPSHTHTAVAVDGVARDDDPVGNQLAAGRSIGHWVGESAGAEVGMSNTGTTGASEEHTNLMPYLTISFIIALVGIYPSRS